MTLPEDYLTIDTPENVTFGYDVAGIGSRFLAALVDTLVIVVLQLIVNLTLLLLLRSLIGDDWFDSNSAIWLLAIFGLISFAFLWGYYIIFEMIWNGQSPGKRWVGLRVIRADGTPITLPESIIRNLVRLIDFLPVYYGVGVVTMFINEQSRRLGDLAAGTLVVRDQSAITLESLASKTSSFMAVREVPAEVAELPIERLTAHHFQMIEDFLRRRYELSNSATLAQHLIEVLYQQMAIPAPQVTGLRAERLLVDLAQAYRNRQAG